MAKKQLSSAMRARINMLKTYMKTHNCSYKQAMIDTKGKSSGSSTAKRGRRKSRRSKTMKGGDDSGEVAEVSGEDKPVADVPQTGGEPDSSVSPSSLNSSIIGGRRRRKSRRTMKRRRTHRRR